MLHILLTSLALVAVAASASTACSRGSLEEDEAVAEAASVGLLQRSDAWRLKLAATPPLKAGDSSAAYSLLQDVPSLASVLASHPEILPDMFDLLRKFQSGEAMKNLSSISPDLQRVFATAPDARGALLGLMASQEVSGLLSKGMGDGMEKLLPLVHGVLNDTAASGALLDSVVAGETKELSSTSLLRLVEKYEPIRRQWTIFITPASLRVRWYLVIVNIVLAALLCGLTSVKSGKRAQESAKRVNLERAMRREVTLEELRQHGVPGDAWLAVEGVVCDVGDFAAVHPGGSELLLAHAGKDATEEFLEVGHSSFASELIRERMVGILVEGGKEVRQAEGGGRGLLTTLQGFVPQGLQVFFTKEDPYQIHKVLGIAAIVHYLVRFAFCLRGSWLTSGAGGRDFFGFGHDWFSLISAWMHVLLQVSSFQFLLPRNRVAGRPMLWQEWRAHNLIFTVRSLLALTIGWICQRNYPLSYRNTIIACCCCYLVVFGQLYFADVASRGLRDSKHESLTASWPLWDGCPQAVERFIKFYYSIAINQLTVLSLASAGSYGPMALNFAGVVVLQTDSFAMTLVRKGAISTASFHWYYFWNMVHIGLGFVAIPTLLESTLGHQYVGHTWFIAYGIPVAVYFARYSGLSKYGVWVGFMVAHLLAQKSELDHMSGYQYWICWLATPVVWAVWGAFQKLLSGYTFEYRVRRYLEGGRPKPLVLQSREQVSETLFRLVFQLPWGYACGLMPGQHARVTAPNASLNVEVWNCATNAESGATELSRSYTPIASPESKTIELIVKRYPKDAAAGFPDGGRVSTFLLEELKVGETAMLSGPHGQRIYFGNGLFEVKLGQPKIRPRLLAVLAGGSGVTPALSVIREMQAEARRRQNTKEAWQLMDYECQLAVEAVHVLHANRLAGDGLPLSFYQDPTVSEELLPVRLCNLCTSGKEGGKKEGFDGPLVSKAISREGRLDRALVEELLPAPAPDVLVLICGPHAFIQNICQPVLKEIGHENVIAMW